MSVINSETVEMEVETCVIRSHRALIAAIGCGRDGVERRWWWYDETMSNCVAAVFVAAGILGGQMVRIIERLSRTLQHIFSFPTQRVGPERAQRGASTFRMNSH